MIIDITPQLDALRHLHGIVNVAVLGKPESLRCAEALSRSQFNCETLPDGRTKIFIRGTHEGLQALLSQEGVTAETWIVLVEDDERYDEATYTATIDDRAVEVRTGMLDELFGYIAVQSSDLEDVYDAIELHSFRPAPDFDDKFTRVAVSEHTASR